MDSTPRELRALFSRKRLQETAEADRFATLQAVLHNGLMPRKDGQAWTPYQFGMKEPAAFRNLRAKVEQIKAERSVRKKAFPKWATPTDEQKERTRRRAGGK